MDWTTLETLGPGLAVVAETAILIWLALRNTGRLGGRIPAGFISGRANFNQGISEMFDRAKPGDLVFGECRRCTDLGEPFYSHLPAAIARGAKLHVMISADSPSIEGARYFLGLQSTEIRASSLGSLRIVGIAGKEAFLLIDRSGEYVGLHFTDKAVARGLYRTFETEWNNSKTIDTQVIASLETGSEVA